MRGGFLIQMSFIQKSHDSIRSYDYCSKVGDPTFVAIHLARLFASIRTEPFLFCDLLIKHVELIYFVQVEKSWSFLMTPPHNPTRPILLIAYLIVVVLAKIATLVKSLGVISCTVIFESFIVYRYPRMISAI